ncbi:IS sequence [Streptomyces lincolnensis]|uniref:IS sequence n=1 Tax=Streptomyces lincolnensis TaxID=1915 RepID=A0A1B1M2E3_STRLN|nr:IS sequence [Streptomyces lincolnensis]AXG51739.1 IS sequence [Streptomyces lincolnensis]
MPLNTAEQLVFGGAERVDAAGAAIVDLLTFNGAIVQTGTESYRLPRTKAQAERAAAG